MLEETMFMHLQLGERKHKFLRVEIKYFLLTYLKARIIKCRASTVKINVPLLACKLLISFYDERNVITKCFITGYFLVSFHLPGTYNSNLN